MGQGFLAGVAEQWTHFGTLQEEGRPVPNPLGQTMDSSISQAFVDYNFNERFGLQLNLPVAYRAFRRPEGLALERGTETGLGDMSLIGHLRAYRHETEQLTVNWSLLAGLKFPTGSTRRLREELAETEESEGPVSAIHGHDLTLGSGSWDGIVGTTAFARWKRLFCAANVQYAIRSEGDYEYQFANDLLWSSGPGLFLALGHDYTFSLEAAFSGETKGRDTLGGRTAEDTGLTSFYVGPQFAFTWREKLSAELAVDVPFIVDNTVLQIVPDYRVRAGVSWRF
jgi:hypothetical protein